MLGLQVSRLLPLDKVFEPHVSRSLDSEGGIRLYVPHALALACVNIMIHGILGIAEVVFAAPCGFFKDVFQAHFVFVRSVFPHFGDDSLHPRFAERPD